MKIRRVIFTVIVCVLLFEVGIFVSIQAGAFSTIPHPPPGTTSTATVTSVDSQIIADGSVTAVNQQTLHFQTGGMLTSLPLKEGDQVSEGQTIAQIDTYALQQQLDIAANNYEAAKNDNSTTLENQKATVLEGETRSNLDTNNKNGYQAIPETTVIYDTVGRMVDNSILSQSTAQLNENLANYAIQLSTLTSPLTGIVSHEDVTSAGVNVTTDTSFIVEDPSSAVFRADVPASDIDFISTGNTATIFLDGMSGKIQGTVTKIYPEKMTLTTGEDVYQVDITSDQLKNAAKLDQSGTVIISTSAQSGVVLVPAWTVQGNKYIWVDNNGTPVLKTITVGKVVGQDIEVTGGLKSTDKIVTDPQSITSSEYHIL